jgi:hypothetical protein
MDEQVVHARQLAQRRGLIRHSAYLRYFLFTTKTARRKERKEKVPTTEDAEHTEEILTNPSVFSVYSVVPKSVAVLGALVVKNQADVFRPRHARSFAERSGEAEVFGGVLEHVTRVALAQAIHQQPREQEREHRQKDPDFLTHGFFPH